MVLIQVVLLGTTTNKKLKIRLPFRCFPHRSIRLDDSWYFPPYPTIVIHQWQILTAQRRPGPRRLPKSCRRGSSIMIRAVMRSTHHTRSLLLTQMVQILGRWCHNYFGEGWAWVLMVLFRKLLKLACLGCCCRRDNLICIFSLQEGRCILTRQTNRIIIALFNIIWWLLRQIILFLRLHFTL